jgi:hypothetical protein
MGMITKRQDFIRGLELKLPKERIAQLFNEYCISYDDGERNIKDKLKHRELFEQYTKYMYFSGRKE